MFLLDTKAVKLKSKKGTREEPIVLSWRLSFSPSPKEEAEAVILNLESIETEGGVEQWMSCCS